VTFNTLPGPPNMTVLHIMPTGPETTLEHFDLYSLDKTPSECEREAMKYINDVLQPEDIGLVESVQRGLHSRGYRQGRFIVDKDRTYLSEHGVHHFHGLVLEALGELT
jgi:choline monooxygenase